MIQDLSLLTDEALEAAYIEELGRVADLCDDIRVFSETATFAPINAISHERTARILRRYIANMKIHTLDANGNSNETGESLL